MAYKIVFILFFVFVLYFANKESSENIKSSAQLNFEKWLSETEVKSISAQGEEALPVLTLTMMPSPNLPEVRESSINANNIKNARERIMRLLQLVNEAGLYNFQDNTELKGKGEIILKILGANKSFMLVFSPKDIEGNIKAALFLKLFDEYSKEKFDSNLALKKETNQFTELKENIYDLIENKE